MKVAVDSRLALRSNPRGMARIGLEIMRAVVELGAENPDIQPLFYTDVAESVPPELEPYVKVLGGKSFPVWEQWSLGRACAADQVDLLICPYNTAPLRISSKTSLVMVINDAMFAGAWRAVFRGSSMYQKLGAIYRRVVAPRAAGNSSRIVTISHYSKDELSNKLGIPSEKIDVILPSVGYLNGIVADDENLNSSETGIGQYILHVGGVSHNKNSRRALQVFAKLRNDGMQDLRLVMLGIPPSHQSGFLKTLSVDLHRHVVFYWSVTDGQLAALYRSALALLVTSTDEGFGLPVVEAMHWGTAVVASSMGSIPEAADGAALLVERDSIDLYVEKIHAIDNDSALRDDLISKGHRRLELISPEIIRIQWKNTLKGLLYSEQASAST